jgi:23S rRNA pseudouridine1911/1915/1917 synthase
MPGRAKLKASTKILAGQELKVFTEHTAIKEPDVDLNYSVIYEDEHILAVNKPGNLPVHPAGRFLFNTLLMQLRRERPEWIEQGHDFYLSHRLDRETSGVILLAKTSKMAGSLVKQFRERKTEKRYYAITARHLPDEEVVVDADIGTANSHIRLKMKAFPKGTSEMNALTIFKVVRRGPKYDLVDCELKTGRQHQIRVHLEYIGCPVVGDKLYGAEKDELFLDFIHKRALEEDALARLGIKRQALHSRYLRFFHEGLGKWMELESPLPPDMEELLLQS